MKKDNKQAETEQCIIHGISGSFSWTTDYYHNDNAFTMTDFLENHLPDDVEIYTSKDTEQLAIVITDRKKYRPKKAVKKTLSIPYWLNELAEKEHINFSGVLQEALKKRLGV